MKNKIIKTLVFIYIAFLPILSMYLCKRFLGIPIIGGYFVGVLFILWTFFCYMISNAFVEEIIKR